MRTLNRRFLRHDRPTDVLTFRYDGARPSRTGSGRGGSGLGANRHSQPRAQSPEPIIGDILIAPDEARRYARAHGLAYSLELSRYVVHGLLHWLGHDDRTPRQQTRMRRMEDRILADIPWLRAQGSGLRKTPQSPQPRAQSRK
jgi:rRNA maturation RNase YbeY